MEPGEKAAQRIRQAGFKKESLARYLVKNKYLYLMLAPMALWYLIFRYLPMYGIIMSFQQFKYNLGFSSPFVGFSNFKYLFTDRVFLRAFYNTFTLNFMKLLLRIPMPVIFALLVNEMRGAFFRRLVQTVTSVPHFISWVALCGIIVPFFALNTGVINIIISLFGGEKVNFMVDLRAIRWVMALTDIWKELGWLAIIYLAAISGINPVLYESAIIDGASRFRRIIHITLPCIKSTIAINTILAVGNIMQMGFDQIFNMYNPAVYEKVDIIDTFVVRNLSTNPQFGILAAADMVKAFICLGMLLLANKIIQKMGEEGIYSVKAGL
jgi:putative aldouronate transport system permease protein